MGGARCEYNLLLLVLNAFRVGGIHTKVENQGKVATARRLAQA
jgi:hypothetical protein